MLNLGQQQFYLFRKAELYSKFSMAVKMFYNSACLTSLALHQRKPFINNVPKTVCANLTNIVRCYAKKGRHRRSDCRLAKSDIPPAIDPDCPVPCAQRRKKRLGILHWLKLKVVEGGTNFGS